MIRCFDAAITMRVGLTRTYGPAAAIVMVAVFSIFATLSQLDLKQAGFGLAVAILIDATLVRGVLLPAAMTLLGERNWYLPSRLEWLPHIHMPAEQGRILTASDPLPPGSGILQKPRLVYDDPA